MKLCIDAGHIPNIDPGAVGNGLKEANLTGDLAQRVAAKLSPYDVEILMVPRTDSLQERCDFANKAKVDYFLSLHVNAGGGEGFESYVYTGAADDTERMRGIIHDAVTGYLKPMGVIDRGKKRANFAVLQGTDMPAVLLENLFIDNPEDAAMLKYNVFLDGLANNIAYGVAQALGLQRKEQADPCAECRIVAELKAEINRLRDLYQMQEQDLKRVAEITARYKI